MVCCRLGEKWEELALDTPDPLRAVGVAVGDGLIEPLETKLHAPGARKEWVEREKLISHLASDVAAKLVLFAAPAGFGKTTAIAQWRASMLEGRAFAWVSLDRGDDDPTRLWLHVVAALQRACPGFGAEPILRALRVRIPDIAGTVLPLLVNELGRLRAPVVLVLDDYYLIGESRCHEQVAFVLNHLPPTVQIVLATRTEPPLPLARLRLYGEIVEVRAQELRFSAGQAAALVHTVSDLELSQPDLTELVHRTEGWPAGLYLAALSLRSQLAPGTFIRQFSGSNRFIAEFLAEEVLTSQPPEIRQFLLRTAVLDRFCAPLCDAVAGTTGAASIIDGLERDNLFLVPLDDDRRWYRYHHLFAQALRVQLARAEPAIVPVLHQRASQWHRESGTADEAIGHAFAAGDVAGAVDLVARFWRAYMDIGLIITIRGWMRTLGDDRISAYPLAAHCAAWCAALTGEPESLRRWLPVLEAAEVAGPLPDGIRSLKSSAALVRATFGFDGIRVMLGSARTAAELEDDPKSPWYGVARAALGSALYLSGELDAAARPLAETFQTHQPVTVARVLALSVMTLVGIDQGRLAEVAELAREARQLVGDGELAEAPQAAMAYIAAGAVYAGQGRLGAAREEFEHALRIRQTWPGISPWPTVLTTLRLAPVLDDLGERPAAIALAAEARAILAARPDGAGYQRARLSGLEQRFAAPARPVAAGVAGVAGKPLTDSEIAVLRLLEGTLSLRQIGQELYVSHNTVKTHVRSIYRKLGTSTRPDAVARGRDLGVLI
jgi:LuxR family transcriptional regulator, maltose regulon positive regulatory protein